MGQPAACLGHAGDHGGALVSGSGSVICEGKPLSGKGDVMACPIHGPGPVDKSSASVFVCGKGVARVSDLCACGSSGAAGAKVPATATPEAVESDGAGGVTPSPSLAEPATNDPEAVYDSKFGTQELSKEWADGVDSKLEVTPHGQGQEITGLEVKGHLLEANFEDKSPGSFMGPNSTSTYEAQLTVGDFKVNYDPDHLTAEISSEGLISGHVSAAAEDGLGNSLKVELAGGKGKGVLYGIADVDGGHGGAGAQVKPLYGKLTVEGEFRLFELDGYDAPNQIPADISSLGYLEQAMYYGQQATAEVMQWGGYFEGGGKVPGIKASTAKKVAEFFGYTPAEADDIANATVKVKGYIGLSKNKGSSWDIFAGSEDADVGAEGFDNPLGPGEVGMTVQMGVAPTKPRATEAGGGGLQGVSAGSGNTFVGD